MAAQTHTRGAFRITTDKAALDLDAIHAALVRQYWCEGIPRSLVERAIANSLCFGVFDGAAQIGFGRVISDFATFAYLADVYILESHRGQGLSKWLMECILAHPDLQGLRRFTLVTRDAQGLYSQFGFSVSPNTGRAMEISRPGMYLAAQSQSPRGGK
jgi:GNAT superfamily N-acetyltransferase